MGQEYGGIKMAGYFFVTGMTVIEFPDGIQWNERAKPTFTGALAELLPSMIDGFGPCAPLSLWSESMSPEECYYFMYGVTFDFIIGGRERPAEPEPEPEPELGPDGFPEIILDKWTGVATYSFSFLSPDGKQVVTLNDCLWNEKVKPEEGGEPVSARYLTEKGYKQLTGPTFEYDTRQGLWEGVGDYFVEDGDDEDNEEKDGKE